MLPINRLDKFLFICLYNFANSFNPNNSIRFKIESPKWL